ncbi:hypothetical protein [Paenibacillus taichungensis]|uniref:hypothetical protein n=1 Tax=Paenibacillus taichungensis TaxID=484184 RepID=UPI0035E12ABC
MKRYEIIEFSFLPQKKFPEKIRKSLRRFLEKRGIKCILEIKSKKVTKEEIREELMTVLDPPAQIKDIDLILFMVPDKMHVHRWFLEIDSNYEDEVQSFLSTHVSQETFPLLLVETI